MRSDNVSGIVHGNRNVNGVKGQIKTRSEGRRTRNSSAPVRSEKAILILTPKENNAPPKLMAKAVGPF